MKKLSNILHPDKKIFLVLCANFLVLIIALFYALVSYPKLPPLVPLFNQLSWGPGRLAIKEFIFIPLTLAIIIFIINFILSRIVYQKIPIVSRMLVVTSLFISILAFFIVIRTISLII